ncbi:Class E vacuolar protein-sorting machinery protein HSE1 [Smittium mucronatum]|uniref:Class E vacuolar protein-sorting machinery protein HSE1 n=1 Tax=Smittium mucronatum TaxID=133383 RepID=A0A1R0H313_9FUNG|nr:Class E vacuolar protein-sorting machinery protein HSE1 [Smittium mucronatum]
MEETYKNLQSQGTFFLPSSKNYIALSYLIFQFLGFMFPKPQKPQKIPKQDEIAKRQEEEDLLLALALSLSDADNKKQTPAMIRKEIVRQKSLADHSDSTIKTIAEVNKASNNIPTLKKNPTKVKALFDFTPTETGELGFVKGDVITVLDQKYRDWWTGELRGKKGIFPANFVQQVKDIKPEQKSLNDFEELVTSEAHNVEVLLRMLSRLDPQNDSLATNTEIQSLYSTTLSLRPKIVKLIEEFSIKKDNLVNLNNQLTEAMDTYEMLMSKQNAPDHGLANNQYINQSQGDSMYQSNFYRAQNTYPPSNQHLQQSTNPQYEHTPPANQSYQYGVNTENINPQQNFQGYSNYTQSNIGPTGASTQQPSRSDPNYQPGAISDNQYHQMDRKNMQSYGAANQQANIHSASSLQSQVQPDPRVASQGYPQSGGYTPAYSQTQAVQQPPSNQQYAQNLGPNGQGQNQMAYRTNNP